PIRGLGTVVGEVKARVVDVDSSKFFEVVSGLPNFDTVLLPAGEGVHSDFELSEAQRALLNLILDHLYVSGLVGELQRESYPSYGVFRISGHTFDELTHQLRVPKPQISLHPRLELFDLP